jgi:hypothetical protein
VDMFRVLYLQKLFPLAQNWLSFLTAATIFHV